MLSGTRVASAFLGVCLILPPALAAQSGPSTAADRSWGRMHGFNPQIALTMETVRLPGTHPVSHLDRRIPVAATVVFELRSNTVLPQETHVQMEAGNGDRSEEFAVGTSANVILRDANTIRVTLVPAQMFGPATHGPLCVRLLLPSQPPRATAEHQPPLELHRSADGTETVTSTVPPPAERMPSAWIDLGTLVGR